MERGIWLCLMPLILVGCDSAIVEEAKTAESEGRVINNEMLEAAYPRTFRRGSPAYLERDFEAGADMICDEIALEYGRDICAEPQINWR